jgi:D-hexose-6-phosphate mutarotase
MNIAEIDRLNQQFAIHEHLRFESGPGGLVVAQVDNPHASAMIATQGAHVMTYQQHGEEPLLWLSKHAKFASGKSIRGGVPICWPWFGPHGTEPSYPGHGFARTVPWEVSATRLLDNGATHIEFRLPESSRNPAQWPHVSEVFVHITVGETLGIELVTRNTGDQAFILGDALHTYFAVSDVRRIVIHGLEGCSYIDKVEGSEGNHQADGVSIRMETDRIYQGSERDCVIDDPGFGRRIRVAKKNSRTTVVWNPWIEKAQKMGDFGENGYLGMVCVESANAADDVVNMLPGDEQRLAVVYSVEAMDN